MYITVDLREIGCEGVDQFHLFGYIIDLWIFVNTNESLVFINEAGSLDQWSNCQFFKNDLYAIELVILVNYSYTVLPYQHWTTWKALITGNLEAYFTGWLKINFLKNVIFVKKVHKISKETQCYIKSWKYPPCLGVHLFSLFLMFDATQETVFSVMLEMYRWEFCVSSSKGCGLFLYIISFKNPQRCKSHGVTSGDQGVTICDK
jgi:hypothetical protein